MFSLLSYDLCWLLIGYSLLDVFFLIWLFPCLVVLRVSVFHIANWLLFVWTCVRNHNLTACHFHNILYNWYISVICLDLCHKSQSCFLFLSRVKAEIIVLLIFLSTLCFSKFSIQLLYHPYILHCRMFALTIYDRNIANFVNFI